MGLTRDERRRAKVSGIVLIKIVLNRTGSRGRKLLGGGRERGARDGGGGRRGQVLVDLPGDAEPPRCGDVAVRHERLRGVSGDRLADGLVLLGEEQLLDSPSSKGMQGEGGGVTCRG